MRVVVSDAARPLSAPRPPRCGITTRVPMMRSLRSRRLNILPLSPPRTAPPAPRRLFALLNRRLPTWYERRRGEEVGLRDRRALGRSMIYHDAHFLRLRGHAARRHAVIAGRSPSRQVEDEIGLAATRLAAIISKIITLLAAHLFTITTPPPRLRWRPASPTCTRVGLRQYADAARMPFARGRHIVSQDDI